MRFTVSLRSEILKVKRTSVVYLVLAAAFVIPFILVFDHGVPDPAKPTNGWDNHYKDGFMVFAFAFLQLFHVLSSTLVLQIEIRNNTWKQVLASPQSYLHILLSKWVVIQLLGLLFIVVFNVYMILGAALLDAIYHTTYLEYLGRWSEILKVNLMAFTTSIGMSTLSFWLALHYRNFIAPIALGFLLWLTGPIFAFEFKWPYLDLYVSALPFSIISRRPVRDPMLHQLLSIGYGVLFFSVACLEFSLRRTRFRALLR